MCICIVVYFYVCIVRICKFVYLYSIFVYSIAYIAYIVCICVLC